MPEGKTEVLPRQACKGEEEDDGAEQAQLDKPVSAVSVADAFRTGKSFLLDFMLRYLKGAGAEHWLDSEDALDHFHWIDGYERDTMGILMLTAWIWDNMFQMMRVLCFYAAAIMLLARKVDSKPGKAPNETYPFGPAATKSYETSRQKLQEVLAQLAEEAQQCVLHLDLQETTFIGWGTTDDITDQGNNTVGDDKNEHAIVLDVPEKMSKRMLLTDQGMTSELQNGFEAGFANGQCCVKKVCDYYLLI